MFQYENFFNDFHIEYWTSGKNVTYGWINVNCPFCDDHSNHLGFDLKADKLVGSCWRCGKHSLRSYIKLHIPRALKVMSSYEVGHRKKRKRNDENNEERNEYVSLPGDSLQPIHKRYLRSRRFSPIDIQRTWGIKGTVGKAPKDLGGAWRNRIAIPIYQFHELVSFQGRDVTEQANEKYRNCPSRLEITSIKDCLYGLDKTNKKAVVVEGVFDVWRLGPGAICTFGTKFTRHQLAILNTFKELYIYFDPEPDAQKAAESLAYSLPNVEVHIIRHDKEPDDLTNEEAEELMKTLGFTEDGGFSIH